ncbi:MAG: glycosyltransferase family 4 protein [Alloprevotella sp.]
MNDRLKIFVSAYACEPASGSEIGVGWHWVLEMSKRFELWVLTRESNRRNIEPWISEHPEYANIHWLYFDLPLWARFWKKGLRGVRTYYNIWQFCTDRIVRRTMREHGIELFHHLTYGNVLWHVSRYGRRKFFIWGPVGGLETIPSEYSHHYDRKSRIIEALRRAMAGAARFNPALRSRCRHADLILCKTEITRRALPPEAQGKAMLFTDVAAEPLAGGSGAQCPAGESDATEFITVGRLDAWRGFDLAIEALAEASKTNTRHLHLTIVGSGTDRLRLETLAGRLGVADRVTFAGKVPMDEYRRLMARADVVVNAALKEGAVTVSFDAMAMGKPLLCLDTTGYTRYFSSDFAIVIPRTGRAEAIARLKEAMLRLTDKDERQEMGRRAQAAAQEACWQRHGEEIYDAIIGAYNRKTSI